MTWSLGVLGAMTWSLGDMTWSLGTMTWSLGTMSWSLGVLSTMTWSLGVPFFLLSTTEGVSPVSTPSEVMTSSPTAMPLKPASGVDESCLT